ncbi:adenylate/guanylate cyclase domain-containing protein [Maribacter sp. HTCC2170]|uniref:adenylate/guanylate cyclase domain-containing protein n=1 Tax=Maribacter sp. (strain HTCC2170 / KCCM 42371) TaxID=313603 RepID=UPI00006AFD49|nr:adenylate/guanylate cyclase domain-containing protein [Maribacter sp. HTCC2170]EAR01371.1 adenylate cyclase-related protein [Maribacter sp. HTCC2170]
MKFRIKRRWGILRDYVIGWTLAFLFLSIVRGIGTIELSSVQFEFWETVVVSCIFGPIFGSISGFVQILTEERYYRRVSIYRLLFFRLVYATVFLFSLVLLSYFMVTEFFGEAKGFFAFAFEPGSASIYFFILTVDILMLIVRQVNLMLGENNLSKLLRGKFYTPREEERIFMFLDLQSSTQHAETLGHIKYSKMIQDCFNDLGVVVENEAEIYQYVGDEVILTWKLKDGLRNQNCLDAYFNFKNEIEKRSEHYITSYGSLPFFKAGLNSGTVTVTEVGKYKKEIAYHGDTINTAARIQGKCNELNQELLISEHLMGQLDTCNYIFEQLGSIPLKGKANEVMVMAVGPN